MTNHHCRLLVFLLSWTVTQSITLRAPADICGTAAGCKHSAKYTASLQEKKADCRRGIALTVHTHTGGLHTQDLCARTLQYLGDKEEKIEKKKKSNRYIIAWGPENKYVKP